MKKIKFKVFCLMIAIVMAFSMTATVWAVEEDFDVIEPVDCLDGCAEHSHGDGEFVEIEPMSILCAIFDHSYGDWYGFTERSNCRRTVCPTNNNHRILHFRERWCSRCGHRNEGFDPNKPDILTCL